MENKVINVCFLESSKDYTTFVDPMIRTARHMPSGSGSSIW